jgi:hypothetical protein
MVKRGKQKPVWECIVSDVGNGCEGIPILRQTNNSQSERLRSVCLGSYDAKHVKAKARSRSLLDRRYLRTFSSKQWIDFNVRRYWD